MTRFLPSVQLQASSGPVSPGGNALPSFEAAVAAHVFEPELAPRVLGKQPPVRRSVTGRNHLLIAINVAVGGFFVMFWLASLAARGALDKEYNQSDLWLWFAFAWLALGGIATLYHHRVVGDELRWLRDGVPMAGYVADKRMGGGETKYAFFIVRVQYRRGRDRLTVDDIPVTKAVYDQLEPGATITLIRHPDHNGMVRPYFDFANVEVA